MFFADWIHLGNDKVITLFIELFISKGVEQ